MASLGDLVVRMRGDISDFQRKMNKVERRLGRLERSFNRVGAAAKRLKTWLLGLGGAYLGFRGLQSTLGQFMQFDDIMRKVGARSQATQNDLGKLTNIAEELGRTTSHTAVEIGEMMGILGQAGFKPNQIGNMIDAVADLKRATDSDSETAAGVVASSLRVFGLHTMQASRIADAFTSATIESQASLEDLAGAMSYVGKNVTSLGLSLEQTLGYMELLHNRNIKGERAGTALRRTFSTLAAEADRLGKVFGTSLIDDGAFVGVPEALKRINAATTGMAGADKLKVFKEAFQLLGMESAMVLAETNGQLDELVAKMGKAGATAKDVAAFMDGGFGGVVRRLSSAWSGLIIRVGRLLATMLTPLLERLTGLLNHLASDESMTKLAKTIESVLTKVSWFFANVLSGDVWAYFWVKAELGLKRFIRTMYWEMKAVIAHVGDVLKNAINPFGGDVKFLTPKERWGKEAEEVPMSEVILEGELNLLAKKMEEVAAPWIKGIADLGLPKLFKDMGAKAWDVIGKENIFGRGVEKIEPVKDTVQSLNQGAGAALLRGTLEAYQTQFLRRSPQLEVAKKQLEEQKKANQKLDQMPQEFGDNVVAGLAKGVVGVN